MRKLIFVFCEYVRGLNRLGLTGGTIALYETVLALTKAFDVRVFSFDPKPRPDNLGELSAKTIYLPPAKVGGFRCPASAPLRQTESTRVSRLPGGWLIAVLPSLLWCSYYRVFTKCLRPASGLVHPKFNFIGYPK
jgi:hypothetical protein